MPHRPEMPAATELMHYIAADPATWQGRVDANETLPAWRWHQRVQCRDLRQGLAPDDAGALALLGFGCDAGVRRNQGRPGAAGGPAALRAALANCAVRDAGDFRVLDLGDIHCPGDELEAAQATLATAIDRALQARLLPLVMGGGHELAWASFQGLRQRVESTSARPSTRPSTRLGIINFDAHFDLRRPDPVGNSGTPFRQIAEYCALVGWPFHYLVLGLNPAANSEALFSFAADRGVRWVEDVVVETSPTSQLLIEISAFLERVDALYLTLCLDVFNAAAAPGVSAPAAVGISPAKGLALLTGLLELARQHAKPVWLVDIAELNPHFDIDTRTAKLAARLAWTCQQGWQAI